MEDFRLFKNEQMRNPIYTTLFILAAIVFISCDQAQNNDPMALLE